MNGGWIKLYRKLIDSPLWKDCNDSQKVVMITLLLMADHKPNRWLFQGEEYKTSPGQFVTSLKSIAEASGTNISVVRRALVKFEKYKFCSSKSTNKNRLITIENWEVYQGDDGDTDKQTDKQPTSNRQATDKQPTTNKNVRMKESKKEDIYTQFVDGFHAICPSFPRVMKVTDTRKRAIKKAMEEHNLDTIKTVFKKAEASDFLAGRSSDFKASFDWILKPANFVKILEGNYDNRKPKNKEPLGGRVNVSAIEEYERLKNAGQL